MQIRQYLQLHHIPFDLIEHDPTYGASRMAQAVHVAGQEVAKAVLVHTSDLSQPFAIAVVPSTHHVNLHAVAQALNVRRTSLASEQEVGEQFPDCELGAVPPFGSQYGMPTLVDQSLTRDEEIVFEANTHQASIRMRFADYLNLEVPTIADFAVRD